MLYFFGFCEVKRPIFSRYFPRPFPGNSLKQSNVDFLRFSTGLVSSIGALLTILPPPSPPFGISSNPHPFISLLRSSPTMTSHFIALEMKRMIKDEASGFDRLTPVFLFAFCNPHQLDHLAPFRQQLKRILFARMGKSSLESHSFIKNAAARYISW